MGAPAGFELLSEGSWNPGSVSGEWSPCGCGCCSGSGEQCSCGGSCGCKGDGGGSSGGGKSPDEVPLLPDYEGQVWASPSLISHELPYILSAIGTDHGAGTEWYWEWPWWWPCFCPCKKGQVDVAEEINEVFNAALAKACESGEEARQVIADGLISGGGGMLTGIEKNLEESVKIGAVDGNSCRGSASALMVCGVCIGTDKLGHFVEEGLMYNNIEEQLKGVEGVRGDRVARAIGYLLEGLDPLAEGVELNAAERQAASATYRMNFAGNIINVSGRFHFGNFADPPLPDSAPDDAVGGEGRSSPADIAANEAGALWWKSPMSGQGCLSKPSFDICHHVTVAWDEGKNPRKKICERPKWVMPR